jgi:hypothetical protein
MQQGMTSPAEVRRNLLLSEYVASFEKLNEMSSYPGIDPFVRELAVTEPTESGRVSWRPRRQDPQPALLELLYARLPARFPALFESLLLTYRWAEVDLQTYSLMANPSGPDLEDFFRQISRDRGLWEALLPAGYLRFGKGAGGDYDPVCFDMNSRTKSREMRIVKIDHEEILCNYKVKVVAELAPSFEALVQSTIELAKGA